MGFKTFVDNTILTAADVNTYLMKQAVIVCTSGTRPTAIQGMTIYETDTNNLMEYTGSVWTRVTGPGAFSTYTSTSTFGLNATNCTNATGRYQRIGRTVIGMGGSSFAGAVTAGTWLGNVPINASTTAWDGFPVGQGVLNHAGSVYPLMLFLNAGGTAFNMTTLASPAAGFGAAAPVTIGAGDLIRYSYCYEAAAD